MSASDLTIPTLQAPAVNSPVGGALRRRFVWLSSALLLCVQWPASVADTHQVSSPTALNLLALNMVDRGSYRSRQGFEYTKVVPKFLQQLNERVLGGQRASTSCPEDSAAPWTRGVVTAEEGKERPDRDDEAPTIVSPEEAFPSEEASAKRKRSEKFFERLKESVKKDQELAELREQKKQKKEYSDVVQAYMRSTFTEEDLELPDSGALKGENTAAAEAVPQESLEKAASLIREQIAATKHEEEEKKAGKFLFHKPSHASDVNTGKTSAHIRAKSKPAARKMKPRQNAARSLLSFEEEDE